MKINIKIALVIGACLLALAFKNNSEKPIISMNMREEAHAIDGITIGNSKTVQNLSLFILTGKEEISGKSYTTLSEAMDNKQVVVNETGSVNELSIDNRSGDYIFIHSGDIVKGGKQDRTISFDVIIPPNTENVTLESFCVEQGRWQKRADEEVVAFGYNSKMLSSRDLKLAARHEKNQGRVWHKVSEQQAELNKTLSKINGYSVNVSDNKSDTSLQLALESKELKKAKEEFRKALKDLITTPNALGYAYAINGEIYGVEVYNNTQLFTDLWDKILESVIVEAISKDGEEELAHKTKKDVLRYMEAVKKADKKSAKKLNSITNFKTIENKEGGIVFATEDLKKKNWIHRSYMQIDTAAVAHNKNHIQNARLNIENR